MAEFDFEAPKPKLPEEILSQGYEAVSCLGFSDKREVYLLTKSIAGGKYILKRTEDGETALGFAAEKKLLDRICSLNSELSHRFPRAELFIEQDGAAWFIRSYISGRTLSDIVEQKLQMPSLPCKQALGYMIQLTELLVMLHELNPPVICRGLEPDKVIINDEGILSISDIGIYGRTVPPESLGGCKPDPKGDIYSAGMLLMYSLTGGYSLKDCSGIDAGVLRIIKKAVRLDPRMRYGTAQELLADLVAARCPQILRSGKYRLRRRQGSE